MAVLIAIEHDITLIVVKTPQKPQNSNFHLAPSPLLPLSQNLVMTTKPLDPQTIIDIDGYLEPNVPAIIQRHNAFRKWKETIEIHEGGYEEFTKGYSKFGIKVGPKNEVVYREWAPNAKEAYLIGDFSPWFASAFLEATLINIL